MKSSIFLMVGMAAIICIEGCKKETPAGPPALNYTTPVIVDSSKIFSLKDLSIEYVDDSIYVSGLFWIFPWYSSLQIPEFDKLVPPGKKFSLYIRRGSNASWIKVEALNPDTATPPTYEYFIETRPDGAGMYTYGSLYIFYYGFDTKDRPGVKIVGE